MEVCKLLPVVSHSELLEGVDGQEELGVLDSSIGVRVKRPDYM